MSNYKIFGCGMGFLGILTALFLANPLLAQEPAAPIEETAPPSTSPEPATPPVDSTTEPPKDSILSLQGGQKLMSEADAAINAQQYDVAADKLQQARQVFNQLSNFYLQLFDSFSGIDNRIAESQRQKALETGQMRDNATYQLALVHRAQNQAELSVPLLIQVINSQNPRSELGAKAYQQLFEIGFVEEPPSGSESGS
ncbi:hypothetical protein [Myxosarcina sp. GI1]|uniref:hypothetical protein n=1 Tax=Myxosarcina sp. GI1 TaxID=1541065 RepID=UPI00069072B4|nr:hypothetical protein [Myxosarcina sp. GI1]